MQHSQNSIGPFFFLRVDDWLRNNDVHTIFFTAEVSILLRINSASVHIAHVIYHGSWIGTGIHIHIHVNLVHIWTYSWAWNSYSWPIHDLQIHIHRLFMKLLFIFTEIHEMWNSYSWNSWIFYPNSYSWVWAIWPWISMSHMNSKLWKN